jgi:hypothetical protein
MIALQFLLLPVCTEFLLSSGHQTLAKMGGKGHPYMTIDILGQHPFSVNKVGGISIEIKKEKWGKERTKEWRK